jgi:hypothetical protein
MFSAWRAARIDGWLAPALACLAPADRMISKVSAATNRPWPRPCCDTVNLVFGQLGRLVIALDAATGKEENLTRAHGANTKEHSSES